MPPSAIKPPTAEEWENHRSIITELYIDEDMKRADVMNRMKTQYKLIATKHMYEKKFDEWKLKKKLNEQERKYVLQKKRRLKDIGQSPDFNVHGVVWPAKKIKKLESRLPYCELSDLDNVSCFPTPEGISVLGHLAPRPNLTKQPQSSISDHLYHASLADPVSDLSQGMLLMRDPTRDSSYVAPAIPSLSRYHSSLKPLWLKNPASLPYFEFLNLFDSLKLDKNLNQFFSKDAFHNSLDAEPSNRSRLLPANWDSSYEPDCGLYLQPGDSLLLDPGNFSLDVDEVGEFEKQLQHSSAIQTNDLVRPLANILLRRTGQQHDQDALDEFRERERRLANVLADMPERSPGEKEHLFLTLLEPPQARSALFLLTTIIYLHSNQHMGSGSAALKWIVDNVPFESMRTLLDQGLPTLEAFKFDLLLQGVKQSRADIVKGLLEADENLRDFVCRSLGMLLATAEEPEIIRYLLVTGIDIRKQDATQPFLANCRTVKKAQILLEAGANPSAQDDQPLKIAIGLQDFDMILFLVRAGAHVNTMPWNDTTALSLAASFNRVELLLELLQKGASIDQVSDINDGPGSSWTAFRGTALQVAASVGHTGIVRILLDKLANINAPAYDAYGHTALFAATARGHIETVRCLLERGAAIDAPGKYHPHSYTPLMEAVRQRNHILVQTLLDFKANPDIQAFGYPTLLEAALAWQFNDIVECLVAAGAKDSINLGIVHDKKWYLRTQLIDAIQLNNLGRVRTLLVEGAVVDMQPIDEESWPCLLSDFDNEKELTPKGKRLKRRISQRASMLHLAITSDGIADCAMLKILYPHVIDFNTDTSKLEPLLHTAVWWENESIVDYLLDSGVDVNQVASHPILREINGGDMEFAALHGAAGSGNVPITRTLISRGADVNIVTVSGLTPLQAAIECNLRSRREVAMLLLDHGANVNGLGRLIYESGEEKRYTALILAIERRCDTSFIRSLLERGARVNDRLSPGDRTALQHAISRGDPQMVKVLLDNGADVNAAVSTANIRLHNGTALQIAAKKGQIKIAELLLERGADVNMAGTRYSSALVAAAQYCRLDMVQLLINEGADQHLPLNEQYVSALRAANNSYYRSPNLGVIKILQRYRDEAQEKWDSLRMLEMV